MTKRQTKSRGKTPTATASTSVATPDTLEVRRDGKGKIWSHVRSDWLVETPEEAVRQQYLTILVNEYGFALDQIAEEENLTGRGAAKARADFVVWRTAQDRDDKTSPLIIVECKSDNVTIRAEDYDQGDHYARMANAKFLVTHNTRETRYWRVRKDKMPGYLEEIENIPHGDATDKEIQVLVDRLKTFKEDEFADLLAKCHNVIRNREHLDPAAAFDEIAKVLFVKTHVERDLKAKRQRQNRFTVDYLRNLPGRDPLNLLFTDTKDAYRTDVIFADDAKINLKPATGEEIARLLERYNLSDTSEDVKGIAFERFLGRTFRGEIGQFFTPRTIVEFMVRMIEPTEQDSVCDPASGSGGFLIRFFELVREKIYADSDREYQAFRAKLGVTDDKPATPKQAEKLRKKRAELAATLDQTVPGSRLWTLANRRIYGCDANDRMARTSKMNMIMHGDGHGGVHHHNGFLNVNGIFEERFDIILTNPPFGANVEPTDKISADDVRVSDTQKQKYSDAYGTLYDEAQARAEATKGKPIASIFDLPMRNVKQPKSDEEADPAERTNFKGLGKVKTEILFIERCLKLLKPGGRMGVVLPEGIFNNPSLDYVRQYCEDRATIDAVVSLPQETFNASGATVKASLLFVSKFTEEQAAEFAAKRQAAIDEIDAKHQPAIDAKTAEIQAMLDEIDEHLQAAKPPTQAERKKMAPKEIRDALAAVKAAKAGLPEWKDKAKAAKAELRDFLKQMDRKKAQESRQLLKQRFAYPVFFYDAEHVGITATGEQDVNELYPDDALGLPAGMTEDDTALAQYRRFRDNAKTFLLDAQNEAGDAA